VALYTVAWLTGLGRFAPTAMAEQVAAQLGLEAYTPGILLPLYTLAMATLGVLINCVPALGEEIGWRGLLVPELAKETTYVKTALISGGTWAVWHLPGILFADTTATWAHLCGWQSDASP
jgi:uncharacterized protein